MYSNKQSQKLFQLKDIVTISLIIILLFLPTSNVFAATKTSSTSVASAFTIRDLVILNQISYPNLENIKKYNIPLNTNINKLSFKEHPMVTDSQLKSIFIDTSLGPINLTGKKETAYDLAFKHTTASATEVSDWKIVNYLKTNTTSLTGNTATFCAMTFKKDNNIVIAYRGTEVEIGDITQDILYGLLGATGQESYAEKYALAVAKKYPNSNIYITGWSLGGYLSQFGGAALLNSSTYKYNLKGVIYFNGIGLSFWSNIISNTSLHKKQNDTYNTLNAWYKNGGRVQSYYICGDIISSLGKHPGSQHGYYAYSDYITYRGGNKSTVQTSITLTLKLIEPLLNKSIYVYNTIYKPKDIASYFCITHFLNNFLGNSVLYKSSTLANNNYMTVKLYTSDSIKSNKTFTATLLVTCASNGIGPVPKLTTSSFTCPNFTIKEIISYNKIYLDRGKIQFKYNIKLKAKKVNSTTTAQLKLNGNIFNVSPAYISSQCLSYTNKPLHSSPITIKP